MGKMDRNVIPRNYNRITVEMLIKTNRDNIGDMVHVFRNDCGHLGLNMRTMEYSYIFPSMLRNIDCCKITEII